ncbi:MAG: hypothetical protein PVF91_12065 [Chromatiales bacterium]|jgi:hypothetical protein
MAKDDFSRLEARWRKRPLFRSRRNRGWMIWLAAGLLAGLALVALANQLDALSLQPDQAATASRAALGADPQHAAKEVQAHDTQPPLHPSDQRSRPHQG